MVMANQSFRQIWLDYRLADVRRVVTQATPNRRGPKLEFPPVSNVGGDNPHGIWISMLFLLVFFSPVWGAGLGYLVPSVGVALGMSATPFIAGLFLIFFVGLFAFNRLN